MSEYLLINILTILIPLIFSFEKNLKFYKNILPVGTAVLIVGGIYILWDVIATWRGDWSFNPEFLLGSQIFNLPLEEILFFLTVPYASIFIYETFKFYLKDQPIKFKLYIYIVVSVLFITSALIWNNQYYTFTVLLFCALFFVLASLTFSNILRSSVYWIWIFFCFIPFFIVNYFLTSLPIVLYNPDAIWGIRITTIPFEDFFYSFSMLSLYLLIYLLAKQKWQKLKASR